MNRSRQHPCAIHFIFCCGALNFELKYKLDWLICYTRC